MSVNEESKIKYQIEEINVVINEIRKEKKNILELLQKNHATNMKKLMKLQEYNQIDDMTNQVFEMRLSNIENFLYKIENKIQTY